MISSSCDKPYSTIYFALFVQNPNLDAIQPIYVRNTLTRGSIIEMTSDISLKTFLESKDWTPSGKCYEVIKMMKIPGKNSKHPIHFWLPADHGLIHFWLPRDKDLKLGILDQELVPMQDKSGVIHCNVFVHSNELRSHPLIQDLLNEIFQKGQPETLSDRFHIESTSATFSKQDIEIRRCNQIFLKQKDVYASQSIYVMTERKLQEITVTSLQYLLQEQPRTSSRDAIECGTFINDSLIYFHLSLNDLAVSILDSKSMPIKDKYGCIVTRGIMNTSHEGEASDLDLEKIQRTFEIWPNQYRPRTICSTSDPIASFRIAPPAHKMRPQRSFSGMVSSTTGLQHIKQAEPIQGAAL